MILSVIMDVGDEFWDVSFEMWCFFSNMTGSLASLGRLDICSVPPTRKIPSLAANGDNLHGGLLLETLPLPIKVVNSSEKRSVWVSRTQYLSALLISSGYRPFSRETFSLFLVSWRFCCFALLLLGMNLEIQAVTPDNRRQEENLWMANKGRDRLHWNVRLILVRSCLPSSMESLTKKRPSEGQD